MQNDEKGLVSYTHYEVLKIFDTTTLLKITPSTGRKHQIRLHLSSIGYPIIGENLYHIAGLPFLWEYYLGRNYPEYEKHLFLHAYTLEFEHPENFEHVKFIAKIPNFWENFIGWDKLNEVLINNSNYNYEK